MAAMAIASIGLAIDELQIHKLAHVSCGILDHISHPVIVKTR